MTGEILFWRISMLRHGAEKNEGKKDEKEPRVSRSVSRQNGGHMRAWKQRQLTASRQAREIAVSPARGVCRRQTGAALRVFGQPRQA